MRQPRYTTRFTTSASLSALEPERATQMEISASLDRLKGLLPPDIDPEQHPTLLYVVGNLAVGGVLNLNDDGLTLEDTFRIYRSFEWQQINLEHNRGEIRGFIIKAGLSELGTDRLLTEDEARAAGVPCNIAIVFALWKVADRDLAKYILQSAAPGSPTKDALNLSFEVGFDDYSVVLLPKGTSNLALAKETIPSSSPAFKRWDKLLRVNKGPGETKEGRVGRVLSGEIIPLGGGIVTVPAAAVKGITPITEKADLIQMTEEEEQMLSEHLDAKVGVAYEYSSTQFTLSQAEMVPFLEFAAGIPDEDLYMGEEGEAGKYGRENQIHCTALYGLKSNDHSSLATALAGAGPVQMTLGRVTAFENPDKPYDVLKVDVLGDDVHRIHALVKTSAEHEETWPTYVPHITLAYLKRGRATMGYVGDTRFEGKTLSFSSLTFCGADGARTELPLTAPQIPLLATVKTPAAPQDAAAQVYIPTEDPHLMAAAATTLSRHLHLSPGWEARLAALQTSATMTGNPPGGGDPLPNGVNVTLSDGRVLRNVKIFDGKTLDLEQELSFHGVIITDMTPGVPPQADDSLEVAPRLGLVYPNKRPEKMAEDKVQLAEQKVAQNAPYADASLKDASAAIAQALATLISALSAQNSVTASVLPTTPQSMTLDDLKTLQASVQTTDKVEDLKTAFANVAFFAAELAKASELAVQARKDAEAAAAANATNLSDVKAQLADLTTRYNDTIAAQQAAAAEHAFQERMTAVAEVFAFDDETRAEVVTEIKACADEAAFAKWMTRAQRLYKGWLKAEKAAPFEKKEDKKDDDKDGDCAKAAKVALASAAAKVVDPIVNTTIDPTTLSAQGGQSLKQQYMAVAAKNIRIGGETLAEISERASKTVRKTR